jgi:hypothetical protein
MFDKPQNGKEGARPSDSSDYDADDVRSEGSKESLAAKANDVDSDFDWEEPYTLAYCPPSAELPARGELPPAGTHVSFHEAANWLVSGHVDDDYPAHSVWELEAIGEADPDLYSAEQIEARARIDAMVEAAKARICKAWRAGNVTLYGRRTADGEFKPILRDTHPNLPLLFRRRWHVTELVKRLPPSMKDIPGYPWQRLFVDIQMKTEDLVALYAGEITGASQSADKRRVGRPTCAPHYRAEIKRRLVEGGYKSVTALAREIAQWGEREAKKNGWVVRPAKPPTIEKLIRKIRDERK